MAVITPLDLEPILQIDIGNDADPGVVALITRAQDMVEGELGRKIEVETGLTDTFHGSFRTLVLSRWPVTVLTSVVENSVTLVNAVDYHWSDAGIIWKLTNGAPAVWVRTAGGVVVTYNAGFVSTHLGYKELAGVVLRVAARMFQSAAAFASVDGAGAGLSQETIGSYSVSFASGEDSVTGAVSSSYLLDDFDRRVIGRWRSP